MTNDEFDFFEYKPPNILSSEDELNRKLEESDSINEFFYEPDEWKQKTSSNRTISNKHITRCSFSKTTISGWTFRSCTFTECQFIGSRIEDCEFHNCSFKNTNTHKIRFSGTYIDPTSFKDCLDKRKYQNIGVHLFQNLLQDTRGEEQIEFERDALYFFLKWKRFQDLFEARKSWRAKSRMKWIRLVMRYMLRLFHELLLGSGVRISRVILTSIGTVLFFVVLNMIFVAEFGLSQNGQPMESAWDVLYYTVISLTTVGYGDITPTTLCGRVVAVFQSVIGYVLFGILVATLFRRIAR